MRNRALVGKIREVITDKGIYYYKIEKSTTYDYLYLYRKELKEIKPNWWSSKIEKKEILTNIDSGSNGHSDNEGYFWLEQRGDRVDNIKKLIFKILNQMTELDPDWDGVMITDKAKLREILIEKLQSDE